MGKSVLFGYFLFYLGINLLEQIVIMLGFVFSVFCFVCVCVWQMKHAKRNRK